MSYPSEAMTMHNRYKERMAVALGFIEANLDKPLSLQAVASACHFSAFHFHRLFSAWMGETLNDYIARRRLERAINLLAYRREQSITDIVHELGFSSSANFARAVKAFSGFSPSAIREPDEEHKSKIGKLLSKYGKAFSPADLYPACTRSALTGELITRDITMHSNKVEIRQLAAQQVCTLRTPGGYEQQSIFDTWDRLIAWASAQGIAPAQQARYALCYDNPAVTPVDKCRYEAAVVINPAMEVNAPFSISTLPAGKYAVLRIKGSDEQLNNARLALYTEWFPASGFEPDHFPLLERYHNDVREDGFIDVEIHIKLKNLS
ncbi:GyrI-like domain-containing protein [Pokkaliibacter sp. MBI-7]|uniref:AraC family transcriptional regulator n=1 Tax=Pokkaliibacter sp. MBI-7 TaxID=3040600 RepID=UPI00244C8DAB|nr:GyrI-like domain-containing protein [Pokkaliibacter sp. MBI-7]MDH2434676.1 GyrI-like domain-containing protein [Pokkaliibacter sp. MBI-7]